MAPPPQKLRPRHGVVNMDRTYGPVGRKVPPVGIGEVGEPRSRCVVIVAPRSTRSDLFALSHRPPGGRDRTRPRPVAAGCPWPCRPGSRHDRPPGPPSARAPGTATTRVRPCTRRSRPDRDPARLDRRGDGRGRGRDAIGVGVGHVPDRFGEPHEREPRRGGDPRGPMGQEVGSVQRLVGPDPHHRCASTASGSNRSRTAGSNQPLPGRHLAESVHSSRTGLAPNLPRGRPPSSLPTVDMAPPSARSAAISST